MVPEVVHWELALWTSRAMARDVVALDMMDNGV
jgi:hypothetical protein